MNYLSFLIEDLLTEIAKCIDDCSIIPYVLSCKTIKNTCYKLVPEIYKIKSRYLIDNANLHNYNNLRKWFIVNYCFQPYNFDLAFKNKYTDIYGKEILLAYIKSGNLKTSKEIYNKLCAKDISDSILWHEAVKLENNIKIMEWIKMITTSFSGAFHSAARMGNIENVKWLMKNDCPFDKRKIVNDSVMSGNLELIKFLIDRGADFDVKIVKENAKCHNHPHILNWLSLYQN